jgi:hypothetical protein
MDAKLVRQMDAALSTLLRFFDESHDTCHGTDFRNHGMTPAITVEVPGESTRHSLCYSPGCGALSLDGTANHLQEIEKRRTFCRNNLASIHQIDLVPTIAVLWACHSFITGSLVICPADPLTCHVSYECGASLVTTMCSATATSLPIYIY